jgi:hypothetical protein
MGQWLIFCDSLWVEGEGFSGKVGREPAGYFDYLYRIFLSSYLKTRAMDKSFGYKYIPQDTQRTLQLRIVVLHLQAPEW